MIDMLYNHPALDRAVNFLVYSNIWISLESVGIAVATMALAGFPLAVVPIILAFAAPFVVYNVDRFADVEEDAENMPDRTRFVQRYGAYFTTASVILYLLSLMIAFNRNLTTLFFTVLPVLIGVGYSQLDIKNILFVKNVVVGLSWGAIPLLVGAYFGQFAAFEVLFLSGFFAISFSRSAMIYDIKDIAGDLAEGVQTVPNTFNVLRTKQLAYAIDIGLILLELVLILQGFLGRGFLVLIPFHLYIMAYVYAVDRDSSEQFYSFIIDGECIFLGLLVFLMVAIGG